MVSCVCTAVERSPTPPAPPSSLFDPDAPILGEEGESPSPFGMTPPKENITALGLDLTEVVVLSPRGRKGGASTPATALSREFVQVAADLVKGMEECARALVEMNHVWNAAGWKRSVEAISWELMQSQNPRPFEDLRAVVKRCEELRKAFVAQLYSSVEHRDLVPPCLREDARFVAGPFSHKINIVSQHASVSSNREQWAGEMRRLRKAGESLDQWLPVAAEYLQKYDLWKSAKTALAESQRVGREFTQVHQKALELRPAKRLEACTILDSWVNAFAIAQASLDQSFPYQSAQGREKVASMREKVESLRQKAAYELHLEQDVVQTIQPPPYEKASVAAASSAPEPISGWRRWLSCFFSFFRFFFCPSKEGRGA